MGCSEGDDSPVTVHLVHNMGHDTTTGRQQPGLSVAGTSQFEHRVDDCQVARRIPDHDLLLNEAALPKHRRATLGERSLVAVRFLNQLPNTSTKSASSLKRLGRVD